MFFFILTISSFVSACTKITTPGIPTLESRYNSNTKIPLPKPGKDFLLIPINSHVISKQRIKPPKTFMKKGRPAGIGGYKYRIGPQDILSVTVWDHPELTIPAGEFRSATAAGHKVSEEGYFFFPYAGKVHAKGLTTEQVRLSLEKKLAKFITNPQVGISIAGYRSQQAYVSGQVNKAGSHPINDIPLTVRDIIAKSGGLKDEASDYALLTHHKQKIHIDLEALYRKGDNTQNYVLRGGDALNIEAKNNSEKVFVMGEVKQAGSLPFDRFGLTLAEALSDAKGIDEEKASPTGIFVVRQETPKDKLPSVYQLHLTSVHSLLLAEQFLLRPRDIVYVTAAPVTRWNRVISQIIPSLSIVTSTRSLTR